MSSHERADDKRATEKFAQWAATGGAEESARLWQAQQEIIDAYPAAKWWGVANN